MNELLDFIQKYKLSIRYNYNEKLFNVVDLAPGVYEIHGSDYDVTVAIKKAKDKIEIMEAMK